MGQVQLPCSFTNAGAMENGVDADNEDPTAMSLVAVQAQLHDAFTPITIVRFRTD